MLCPMCHGIDSHPKFCLNAGLDPDAWPIQSFELQVKLDQFDHEEVLINVLKKTISEAIIVFYGEKLTEEAEIFANYGVV